MLKIRKKPRLSTEETVGNGAVNGTNYGSISETNDINTEDFSYVEFSGKDGRTCPTCNGTGRIAKEQEDELVALIPYNDRRLKPSRTKFYVLLAVVICLLLCGLVLFFLLPRAVTITEGQIVNYNVTLHKKDSSAVIVLTNQFIVSNTNFFDVQISHIDVEAFFDQVSVGTGHLKSPPLVLSARQEQFPVDIEVILRFNPDNQLDFIVDLCTNPKRKVHDIVIKLQATQTTSYLQHSEQDSLQTYKYIDCSVNNLEKV
uniref:Transmembrane protein 106B n=1 Tax=Phallusia mammillata TaxID=59560 RepID=A0A6F9DUA0_9ASCI|nr:transmembrane protein 106B [Phallusia mammillata]